MKRRQLLIGAGAAAALVIVPGPGPHTEPAPNDGWRVQTLKGGMPIRHWVTEHRLPDGRTYLSSRNGQFFIDGAWTPIPEVPLERLL